MTDGPAQHWSNYWSFGYCTSLPQDFGANYDGELSAFWAAQFNRLLPRARVLDVCTGNGAVALLAAEFSRQYKRGFQISALDAATPNPEALSGRFQDIQKLLEQVNFVGGVPLEKANADGANVDLVTSQYGIEYCDWPLAARKVTQLLKPGGRLALVAHETSSDILSTMENERREYEIIDQLGLMETLRTFLSYELEFDAFIAQLNTGIDGLAAAQKRAASPLYLSVFKMVEPLMTMDEWTIRQRQSELMQIVQNLDHARGRLNDMFRVNSAIRENTDWYRVFEHHGLQLAESGSILYQGEHRCGQYYCFDKPA